MKNPLKLGTKMIVIPIERQVKPVLTDSEIAALRARVVAAGNRVKETSAACDASCCAVKELLAHEAALYAWDSVMTEADDYGVLDGMGGSK